jgi:hypothetical protein
METLSATRHFFGSGCKSAQQGHEEKPRRASARRKPYFISQEMMRRETALLR